MTAAVKRDHLVVLFQDDVFFVVEVQQADRVEFVWYTARCIDGRRAAVLSQSAAANTQRMNYALDCGVVGRMLVLTEREWTDAAALVRVVALWRDDPARPADLLEVDVHFMSLTGATAASYR